METIIFKTAELAEKILTEAKAQAAKLTQKPGLSVVIVGNDPASQLYVKKKTETCRKYGLEAQDIFLKPEDGFAKLEETVHQLNANPNVHGILVQSPLPKGWDERKIQALISPAKDVDGFHPENAGALLIDAKQTLAHGLPPCTPAGVMEILKEAKINPAGKHAVIIGRSTIVGKPMAMMLLSADATVTIAHSKTKDLAKLCATADILVAAVGKARFVTRDFVKPGATLIDVGINREAIDGKNRVVGDIDAQAVTGVASFLTPVPNGVGPMTIALLIRNTVRAAINAKADAKQ
ncbi:MAG: bifunctional 5,10-methylenetetrahydrofolate dehydrogenase/5,10-methenyltetrahydrofolate cyclohydrolase [Bdellovibrionota bacterium]